MLGVNIGANKDADDRVADYVAGVRTFVDRAGYFTINVSSPNTPNLRDLQKPAALDDLLARVLAAREAAPRRVPVLLKIAPDLSLPDLDALVRVARARAVDGMIVSNTTVTRPDALARHRAGLETGGLSGRPLFALSTRMLAETFLTRGRAVPADRRRRCRGCANRLGEGGGRCQPCAALLRPGVRRPDVLVGTIKGGLLAKLGTGSLAQAVGARAAVWAKGSA